MKTMEPSLDDDDNDEPQQVTNNNASAAAAIAPNAAGSYYAQSTSSKSVDTYGPAGSRDKHSAKSSLHKQKAKDMFVVRNDRVSLFLLFCFLRNIVLNPIFLFLFSSFV
jgi:hypothetical protein